MVSATRVLVVEDDPLSLELVVELLGDRYQVTTAENGEEAWSILVRDPGFDVVVADRMMPELGGLELLGRMQLHPQLRHVPVVIETAASDRDQIAEGIRAGAQYYLTKPLDGVLLESMVRAAAADRARVRELLSELSGSTDAVKLLREGRFGYRTPGEAAVLATLLARACPDPERVVVGLTELLANAVEHGNLEISYHLKGQLMRSGRLREELDRRLDFPEYRHRTAEVALDRDEVAITFTIRDQGPGFDPAPYLQIDPDRCFDPNGRGIAIANLVSFDRLEYRDGGRIAVASVRLSPDGDPDGGRG